MKGLEKIQFLAGPQTAVSNTAAETTLFNVVLKAGSLTIPANFLREGASLRITAGGRVTADASPPTSVTIRVKAGSTTLLTFGGISITANLENHWFLDAIISLSALASNQAEACGWMRSTDFNQFFQNHSNAATFDETLANALNVTAQFSGVDAGTSVRIDHCRCTLLNP